MTTQIAVQALETMFAFESKQQWINKAQGWYGSIPRYRREDFLTVDAVGRICTCGAHFSRAEADNTYPITVYRVNEL